MSLFFQIFITLIKISYIGVVECITSMVLYDTVPILYDTVPTVLVYTDQ